MYVFRRFFKSFNMDYSESLFSIFDENGFSINCVIVELKFDVLDFEEEEDESDIEEDEESEVRGDDDLSEIFEEDEEEENENEEENEGGEGERSMIKYMLASLENENFYLVYFFLVSKEIFNVLFSKSLFNIFYFVSINLSLF